MILLMPPLTSRVKLESVVKNVLVRSAADAPGAPSFPSLPGTPCSPCGPCAPCALRSGQTGGCTHASHQSQTNHKARNIHSWPFFAKSARANKKTQKFQRLLLLSSCTLTICTLYLFSCLLVETIVAFV